MNYFGTYYTINNHHINMSDKIMIIPGNSRNVNDCCKNMLRLIIFKKHFIIDIGNHRKRQFEQKNSRVTNK